MMAMAGAAAESHVLWGTWEELILVSAVKKHGAGSWHLVSAELQSRVPTFSFTPQLCKAEYEAIAHRFRCDDEGVQEAEERSRKGETCFTVPNLFEELRKLRVAQLRRELQHYDNSIGSLKDKIKRLQSEQEQVSADDIFDGSVLSGVPRTSSSSDPASDSKGETSICTVEPSGNTDSVALQLEAKAFDVGVHECNSSFSKDSVDTPAKTDIITGLDVKSSLRNMSFCIEEKSSMRSIDFPNREHSELECTELIQNGMDMPSNVQLIEGTKPAQDGFGESHANSDQKSVLGFSCSDGTRELKNVEGGDCRSDKSESSCLLRIKSSPSKWKRSMAYFSSSGDEVSTECDENRLVYRVSSKAGSKRKRNVLARSMDSVEGNRGDALGSKSNAFVKAEILTLEDRLPDNNCGGCGVDSIEPKAASVGLLNGVEEKPDTNRSDHLQLHEVWGDSVEVADKQSALSTMNGKLYGRKRKLMNATQQKVKEEKGFVPNHLEPNTDTIFKRESAVKAESLVSVCEASDAVGSKDENDVERYSANSRVEKSEMGSFVEGNEEISPMSRKIRREPKVSKKLIPLLECLRTICAHRCAHFFRHSHDHHRGTRGYDLVVRAPIDLGMIRGRLEVGHYFGSVPFFRDLLLMVNNALVFYPKDSSESAAASGLRECIVKEMSGFFEREALIKQEGPFFRSRNSAEKLQRACRGKRKSLQISSVDGAKDTKVSSCDTMDGHVNTGNLAVKCVEGVTTRRRTGESRGNLPKRVANDEVISRWPGKRSAGLNKGSMQEPLSSGKGKNSCSHIEEEATTAAFVKENVSMPPAKEETIGSSRTDKEKTIGSYVKNRTSGRIDEEKPMGTYDKVKHPSKDEGAEIGPSSKKSKSSCKDKEISRLSQVSDSIKAPHTSQEKKGVECGDQKMRDLPIAPKVVKRVGRPPKHCQVLKEMPVNPPRKRIKR